MGAQQDARDRDARRASTAWLADQPARSPARRRSCTATTGSATRCSRAGAPARLVAIFDWELATIGDPLADVGYLTATYAQPGDARTARFSARRRHDAARLPHPRGADRALRGALGPLDADVAWYATLALWKAAVFLEGSYKRLLAGTTDDPFFKLLDEGVPELAERALAGGAWPAERTALLVDWGGVLTTDLFASFGAFCEQEGLLAPEALARALPQRPASSASS